MQGLFSFMQPQQAQPQFEYERNPAPRRPLTQGELYQQMGLSLVSLVCICGIVALVAWRHKKFLTRANVNEAEEEGEEGGENEDGMALLHGDGAARGLLVPAAGRQGLHGGRGGPADDAAGLMNEGGGAWGGLFGLGNAPRGRRAQRRDRIEALGAAIEERRRQEEEWTRRKEVKERARHAALAKEEEALNELRAEKKRKADAEFDVWRTEMKVEERGEKVGGRGNSQSQSAATAGDKDNRVAAFENFLKESSAYFERRDDISIKNDNDNNNGAAGYARVIELNSDAVRFALSVERMTEVIESLVNEGAITGILDERGKFYFVTENELNGVAHFIRQRGKVSLSGITTECNRLIAL